MEAIAFIDEAGHCEASGVLGSVPWWSFTKTTLAIAALRLAERGHIALDAPGEDERFTLAQLLRHEAGLPDYGSLARYHEDVGAGRPPWPVEELLRATEAHRPRYEPGTGWAYSNIGYLKVGQLIERASGLELADALAQLVFAPAGLATARLASVPDDLADVEMGIAGYHPGWVYHGLVVGPVVDAARLLRALLREQLLQPDTLARMLKGRPLPEHRSEAHPDPAYGLGLMLRATNPLHHPIGHSGAGPGSRIAVYAQGGQTGAVWACASGIDPEIEIMGRLGKDSP